MQAPSAYIANCSGPASGLHHHDVDLVAVVKAQLRTRCGQGIQTSRQAPPWRTYRLRRVVFLYDLIINHEFEGSDLQVGF